MSDSNMTTPDKPMLTTTSKALLWEGIVLLILGMAAIALPAVTTLTIELIVGAVFLIGGITGLWRSVRGAGGGSQFWNIITALAAIAAGILLLANPLQGVVTLTVLVAILLIVQSGAKLAAGFVARPGNGWGWLLLSGVVDGVLGVLLLMGLPGTAIWAIGLMVGISLIMTGWTAIMMSFGLKKMAQ